MNLFLFRITVIATLLCIVSCTSTEEKLIGTWEFVEIQPELKGEMRSKEFKVKQLSKELQDETYTFREDGTGLLEKPHKTKEFTYIINENNELCIFNCDMPYRIATLNAKEMVWFYDLQSMGGVRLLLKRK